MAAKTPLYEAHVRAGAKMVDFAGWLMPVNYGSQIEEHLAVRQHVGMFDVSHMTIIDVYGPDAEVFLQRVVANNVGILVPNQALYGAVLNAHGRVLDDLIVYRTSTGYRCVVNASTREKMLDWFQDQAMPRLQIEHRDEAMIAVQGPEARVRFAELTGIAAVLDLKPFFAVHHDGWMIGRTGYTGEDGVEVMLPSDQAPGLWASLTDAGVAPAGLGARDTLRLEAGLNLYGQDMDETTSPLISNMGWTVAWAPEQRAFIGRQALEAQRDGLPEQLTGLILKDKGVLRLGQSVHTDQGPGIMTSGSYAPSLGMSIGLARVPRGASADCMVDIRGQEKKGLLVRPPFVRHGRSRIADEALR